MGFSTCDTVVVEQENWVYDAVSDQTNRELLYRPHLAPKTILNIYSQSRIIYTKSLQISYIL